jgi:hypothetical protein
MAQVTATNVAADWAFKGAVSVEGNRIVVRKDRKVVVLDLTMNEIIAVRTALQSHAAPQMQAMLA